MADLDTSGTGGRLKAARDLVGLSARSLDRLAEGTEGYASAVESGACKGARSDLLAGYASVLGISLDWLVRGIGPAPSARRVRAAVLAIDPEALSVGPTGKTRKAGRSSRGARSVGAGR